MKMYKKNTKGTQKAIPMTDASIVSPPYAFGMSNTEEVKRGKKGKCVKINSCKCYAKKTNSIHKRRRTWEPITNLYGRADSTKVWDDQEYKPRTFFSSKLHKQENPKEIIDQSEINNVIYPTSNLKNTLEKISFIGLNRKHKNNQNKRKIGQYLNENSVRFPRYIEPELKFKKKKPKKGLKDHYDNGDQSDLICRSGCCCCEATKENQIIKNSKNKQVMWMKSTKDEHVGHGDQISPTPLNKQDLKDIRRKSSFMGKMMGLTICKCKYNNGNAPQTSSDVNIDNSKIEKTKTLTKENKIKKNSKNKQAKAINTAKNGNFGNGDQISPVPLNKQVLKNSSFFGKMWGHHYNIGSALQTSSDVNNDINKKEQFKTLTKDNKIMKKLKNKQSEEVKKDDNFEYYDQISPIVLNKPHFKDIKSTSNLIKKMMRHTTCECKNNMGRTLQTSSNVNNPTGEPLLNLKVNLGDRRVLNSSEVYEKIKKIERTKKKNKSCICPSRINDYRICKRGRCEQAFENKHTHFNCKCRKHNIIECNDSICDLNIPGIKVKSRKNKRPKSPVYTENNKPLFEVMLDPTNMNIINSGEIQDIILKASQNKIICPTGICNTMSKDRNALVNCKCVGKKIPPFVNECVDRTCRKAEKKCKLSYLCSRVFSKSENRTGQEENRRRKPIRANRHKTNNSIVRSHTHYKKNGVMINWPLCQKPKKDLQETYLEGRLSEVRSKGLQKTSPQRPQKKPHPKDPNKPSVKKEKKVSKRRRKRKGLLKKNKIDDRTLTEKILDCFDKEKEECEKKIKKKTKQYKEKEKLAIRENKGLVAEQKEIYRTQQSSWNFLTNFITGALNVSFETLKTVIKIPFSVLGDPLGSFVYVREKMKHPPAAIRRVFSWLFRTWGNKSSVIARSIDESTTLNVIADTLENSTVYNALMNIKGRTPEETMMHERRKMVRRRRIEKRQNQALYSCKHILLTTMRKTPCLWCYHICPDLYPQCLNFISFMNNFLHLLLYCGAIMCWTPCIVAMEICRAFMCCFLCTN